MIRAGHSIRPRQLVEHDLVGHRFLNEISPLEKTEGLFGQEGYVHFDL